RSSSTAWGTAMRNMAEEPTTQVVRERAQKISRAAVVRDRGGDLAWSAMTAVTYPRVIASEFTKLHSLRSSRLSLLIALGLVVGLGVLVPWLSVAQWHAGTSTVGYNAVERSLSGIYLAQIAFGVLGVLIITGEYATGSIRSTFAAVPRRLPVLWSKLGVF